MKWLSFDNSLINLDHAQMITLTTQTLAAGEAHTIIVSFPDPDGDAMETFTDRDEARARWEEIAQIVKASGQ